MQQEKLKGESFEVGAKVTFEGRAVTILEGKDDEGDYTIQDAFDEDDAAVLSGTLTVSDSDTGEAGVQPQTTEVVRRCVRRTFGSGLLSRTLLLHRDSQRHGELGVEVRVNFHARVAALAPSMQPSERRVAEAIAADIESAIDRSAQELAEVALDRRDLAPVGRRVERARRLVHGLEREPLRDEVRLVVGLVRVVLVGREVARHMFKYLAKVHAAGGWKRYAQAHAARLAPIFAKAFPHARLPPELVAHIVDLWAHVGYY